MKNLKQLLEKFSGKKIAVFGDLMLDHYVTGCVNRISPEAPIPVVDVTNERYSLGGAANVVANIASLGAVPLVFGVYGQDFAGKKLCQQLQEKNISAEFLVQSKERPTTLKTRVVAGSQQMVRIDFEQKNYIQQSLVDEVLAKFEKVASECAGVILEDYNKGFLSAPLIEGVIEIAKKNSVPVSVDPKFLNFGAYKGVSVFKPNLAEFCALAGVREDADDFQAKAWQMVDDLQCDFLVITMGRDGLAIYQRGKNKAVAIPTFAQTVYDVCGAGDAVISSLALALGSGASIVQACQIANHAAGVVCGRIGVVNVNRQEIIDSFAQWEMGLE